MSTSAKDGGAGKSKWTLPPPNEDYRKNWDEIFGKPNTTSNTSTDDRLIGKPSGVEVVPSLNK
jgi:hypothetical protein